MPSPRLLARALAFAFHDAHPLFGPLDLELEPGFTGLVGPNGAGKSTLLRVLHGSLAPTGGEVVCRPEGLSVQLCRQLPDTPDDPIHALARGEGVDAHRLLGLLALEPPALARWPTLSPGERRRWQLGAALATAPDVLLLDEPTNHLDAAARDLLVAALQRFPGVGLVVSHDRALLDALTTRTLRLEGGLHGFPGPYGRAQAAWATEREAAYAARATAQEEARARDRARDRALREHQASVASRSAGRRMKSKHDRDGRSMGEDFRAARAEAHLGRRSAALHRRAEAQTQAVADAPPPPRELGRALTLAFAPPPRRRLATAPSRVEVAGRALSLPLDLGLDRDSRVHLCGSNGAGKSTLLRALLGAAALPPAHVLHLPQEEDERALLAELHELRSLPAEERGRVLQVLAALGVEPARLLASARPSPGEARKLRLARGMGRGAWLLALDEPTNHLDLPSIERLQAALAAWPGALLLVTHDEALAAAVTRVTWRLAEGRLEVRGR